MSAYFGALIRSSGMRIGSAAAPRQTPSETSDGVVEIHEERYAASPEHWSAPAHQEAGTPIADRTVAAATRSLATEGPLSPRGRPAMARDAVAPSAGPLEPAPPAPAGVRAPLPAPEERTLPAATVPSPPSLDPVRLAMQWIAADPDSRGTTTVASRPIAPPPVPRQQSAETKSPRPSVREIGVPVVDEVRPAAPMRQPSARTIAPPPVQSLVGPASVNVHHPNRQDGRRDDRGDAAEETLEISIGTINLHVEALAPRTVVQPASPQAAPRQRTERSGLHRRYLRSF